MENCTDIVVYVRTNGFSAMISARHGVPDVRGSVLRHCVVVILWRRPDDLVIRAGTDEEQIRRNTVKLELIRRNQVGGQSGCRTHSPHVAEQIRSGEAVCYISLHVLGVKEFALILPDAGVKRRKCRCSIGCLLVRRLPVGLRTAALDRNVYRSVLFDGDGIRTVGIRGGHLAGCLIDATVGISERRFCSATVNLERVCL